MKHKSRKGLISAWECWHMCIIAATCFTLMGLWGGKAGGLHSKLHFKVDDTCGSTEHRKRKMPQDPTIVFSF